MPIISERVIKYISIIATTIFWGLLTLSYVGYSVELLPISLLRDAILKFGFYVSFAVFISNIFERIDIDRFDVINTLWRLFSIGMIGLGMILLMLVASDYIEHHNNFFDWIKPVFYNIAVLCITIFLYSSVFTFRRFVLYQRNRRKIIAWNIFQVMGVIAFVLTANPFDLQADYLLVVLFVISMIVLSMVLSFDIEWTSYLNSSQKLKTLGTFCLLLLILLPYMLVNMQMTDFFRMRSVLESSDLGNYVFHFFGTFTFIYSFISVIILFSSIPSASLFETKSNVLNSFNKIHRTIQSNIDDNEILKTLMEGALLAADAKMGWIEFMDVENPSEYTFKMAKGISDADIIPISNNHDLTTKALAQKNFILIANIHPKKHFWLSETNGKSLLCVPIYSNNKNYGSIILLKDYANAFEEHIIQAIMSFSEQAGVALQNAYLIKNSIDLERYQEQLKIAKEVQNKLLPRELPQFPDIEIFALNQNADEVGGDYYDLSQKGDLLRMAVGDVSGKGTTAAFYMAEVKGIFHALTLLDISVREFILHANAALIKCLQKGLFMTLTYLEIDTANKYLSILRAGHCPTLHYNAETDTLNVLREGTLGLGILSSERLTKMIQEPSKISYKKGDFLILYTDGIVEAKSKEKEEFGYERLKRIVFAQRNTHSKQIIKEVVKEMLVFTGGNFKDDDYTILIIKFL